MKIAFASLALLLLLSCGSNQNSKNDNSPVTINKPTKRDSSPAHKNGINPYAPVDLSPLDMTYFPVDFPKLKMAGKVTGQPLARVIYSRPHREGRTIFGNLIKYGEPWRLGANEATEIEFFETATIQNKKVSKGRYIMYCVPQQDKWTIVLNTNIFTWGLKLDPQQDKYTFTIPVEQTTTHIEYFTMAFEPTEPGAALLISWDNVIARLPITF
jgi:hypothetical protein